MSKKLLLTIITLFVLLAPAANAQSTINPNRPNTVNDRLAQRQEDRAELKALIEEKREEKRLEIQTKREEFQTNLQAIKDAKKQDIVERTDSRLSTLNEKATSKLTSAIERLETLLEKFSTRVDEAEAEDKDTTDANAAILAAQTAIEDSKTAVAEQAAKEYVAEIVDEETLKNTVGDAVSTLRQDLRATFDTVILAKQAVMDVARATAKLRGQSDDSIDATPSATIEPSITEIPVATESSSI